MLIKANGTISGIGAGDSINKITIAWALNGTDANADAAVTAGRYKDLTLAQDITDFQGSGTYIDVGTLANGSTYDTYIKVTENMSGGGTQAGGWIAGSSITTG